MDAHTTVIDWNEYARCYDTLLHLKPYNELLDAVSHALLVHNSDKILDAGCGSGNLLRVLSETRTTSQIWGVDLSENMLHIAKTKLTDTEVQLKKGDLNQRLPFGDSSIDKIFSNNVLYAVSNPTYTLREFNRILKPSGRIALTTPKKGYDNGLVLKAHSGSNLPDSHWQNVHASAQREELLIKEAFSDPSLEQKMLFVARCNRIIAKTATFHFFEEVELRGIAEAAGFEVEKLTPAYAGQCFLIVMKKG